MTRRDVRTVALILYGATMLCEIQCHNEVFVREVARMLREGYSPKAIARLMG